MGSAEASDKFAFLCVTAVISGGLAALLWGTGRPLITAISALAALGSGLSLCAELVAHYTQRAEEAGTEWRTNALLAGASALVPLAVLLRLEGGGRAAAIWCMNTPNVPLWLAAACVVGGGVSYHIGREWAAGKRWSQDGGKAPGALGLYFAVICCAAAGLAWLAFAAYSTDVADRRAVLEAAQAANDYFAPVYEEELLSAGRSVVPRVAAYVLLAVSGYSGLLLGIRNYRRRHG